MLNFPEEKRRYPKMNDPRRPVNLLLESPDYKTKSRQNNAKFILKNVENFVVQTLIKKLKKLTLENYPF